MKLTKLFWTLITSMLVLTCFVTPGSAARDDFKQGGLSPARASDKLSDELQLSLDGEAERHFPEVAYNTNHDEYLVVWQNTWLGGLEDIYARRVSASGEVLGWFCVATASAHRRMPAVAYNPTEDEYLVVYMYEESTSSYLIVGRIIPWDGPGDNQEVIIQGSISGRSFHNPRVVWNSDDNEYVIVYNVHDKLNQFPPGDPLPTAGMRLSASGTMKQAIPFDISNFNTEHPVALGYNPVTHRYFTISVKPGDSGGNGDDIEMQEFYYTPSGWTIDRRNLIAWSGNQNNPAATINDQGHYLVVWEHEHAPGDTDIYGIELDEFGGDSSNFFSLIASAGNQIEPDIAAGEDEWLLVYQETLPLGAGQAIKGVHWGPETDLYRFDISSIAFWDNEKPAVAAGNLNYLVAYEGDSSLTNRHIFGRLWWPVELIAPAIITPNLAYFEEGVAHSFTIQATGYPTPTITRTGPLPDGVTFTDNGNGTATLAGMPAAGSAGDYPLTLTASNGIGQNATQAFTLVVMVELTPVESYSIFLPMISH